MQSASLHLAIIMDGNGRWAQRQGLPRERGHEAGASAVRRVVRAAAQQGVGILTLYAFSSDNWRRPRPEVQALMRLFLRYLRSETSECVEKGVRISVIGRRDRLPGMLQRGSGDIVNISSAGGFVTGPGYAAYSPSKFAIRGFSDALRAEVKPRGVRVFLVYPPNTDTPQRAYEVSRQSPEIHHLDENAGLGPWKFGTLPASQVAEEILQGVQRGSYVILPGKGNRILYRLVSLLGDFSYRIVDDEWETARKKNTKT